MGRKQTELELSLPLAIESLYLAKLIQYMFGHQKKRYTTNESLTDPVVELYKTFPVWTSAI